ncbi:MAG: hypothetical protein KDA28_16620, partial [Phycisphaerales bacterium]|nr:hypothetical protein [Phycisphaerales bacterium]
STPSSPSLQWPRASWQGVPPLVALAGGASITFKPQVTSDGDPGVLVTVHGSGSLADGSPLGEIKSVIQSFGITDPAILDPIDTLLDGAATLSTSFLLSAGALRGWSAKILPTSSGFDGDAISDAISGALAALGGGGAPLFDFGLGIPAFEIGSDEGDSGTPSGWRLWFDDCALGFPNVLSLGPTSIAGRLRLNLSMFEFLPSTVQALDLPDLIAFILGELQMLGTWISGVDLTSLIEQVVPFDEWIPWIRIQLEAGTGISDIIDSVQSILGLANDQMEMLYAFLFRAMADLDVGIARTLAIEAWEACFGVTGALGTSIDVSGALDFLRSLESLGRAWVRVFSEALAAAVVALNTWSDGASALVTHLFETILADSNPAPLLRFATDVMTGVLDGLGAAAGSWNIGDQIPDVFRDLADALLDLLDWESPGTRPVIAMTSPGDEAIDVASGPWFVGHLLSSITLQVPAFRDHAGWRFVPDGGTAFMDHLTGLGATIESGASSILCWMSALLDVSSVDLTVLPIHPSGRAGLSSSERDLLESARTSVEHERDLIKLVRQFPPLALPFVVVEAVRARFRPDPVFRYVGCDLESDARTDVLRLPPPGFPMPEGGIRSYVVLSDVHRDCAGDDEGVMRFGSIDHFRDNRAMYLAMLQDAFDSGRTVIEAGDCEELWFIGDPMAAEERFTHSKLRRIMRDNAPIYVLLWDLARQGRYFRVFGNHDSYLRLLWYDEPASSASDPGGRWKGFLEEWLDVVRMVRPTASLSEL